MPMERLIALGSRNGSGAVPGTASGMTAPSGGHAAANVAKAAAKAAGKVPTHEAGKVAILAGQAREKNGTIAPVAAKTAEGAHRRNLGAGLRARLTPTPRDPPAPEATGARICSAFVASSLGILPGIAS